MLSDEYFTSDPKLNIGKSLSVLEFYRIGANTVLA